MMRRLLLWASENAWLGERLPRVGFVRRAVSRFMPGEDVESALGAAQGLQRQGLGALLTLLGENVKTPAQADDVVRHYMGVVEAIQQRNLDAEISVKLTHLGLDLDPALADANLRRLLDLAARHRQEVWVDMEGSAYTQRTLDLFRGVRASHANVGLCLQSYLRRTGEDLEGLLPLHPMIRLVKGAYAEPPTVAFPDKREVDAAFATLARRLITASAANGGPRQIIGTHDRRLIADVLEWAHAQGIPSAAFEFHLLYGIQRDEQLRLAAAGRRVRVLISYGSAWFPWYMRRLAERPANLWFVVRNLLRR